MTTPRDAIGLSERLRCQHTMSMFVTKDSLIACLNNERDEAAAQLDALSAENARLKLRLDNLVSVVSGIESALDCTPDSVAIFDAIEQLKQDRDALQERVKELEVERDSWKAQFESASSAVSEYSEFWERHSGDFDAAGNYIPHSQIDGDLRSALARATRAEQERDEALERAAKVIDAECERILSKQTPTIDPMSMTDMVNLNLRMMATVLPDLAAAIRRLASGPDKEK